MLKLFTLSAASISFLAGSVSALACDVYVTPQTPDPASFVYNHPGEVICFDAGTYEFAASLHVRDNTTVRGTNNDRTSTVLAFAGDYSVILGNAAELDHLTVEGLGGSVTSYGVRIFNVDHAGIWAVNIDDVKIAVGVVNSTNATVTGLRTENNGDNSDGLADPTMWINQSSNLLVRYGQINGSGDGPEGDGAISSYDSHSITIDSVPILNSGAAGIYFVNCDDCVIKNSTISSANEYGLDIQCGSDNITVTNNNIKYSHAAAIDFDNRYAIGGSFTSNYLLYNRLGPNDWGNCDGLNINPGPNALTISGNTGQWSVCNNTATPSCSSGSSGGGGGGGECPPDLPNCQPKISTGSSG